MMLSREEILRGLRTERFGRTLHVFASVGSTNAAAREFAESGAPEGTVILAEHQSAGRGRQGRGWNDIPGENILCSAVLRPTIPPAQVPLLAFSVAVAVADAVEATTGLAPECKWPNDLLLRDRKFCGILLESAASGSGVSLAVAGIGINVNQRAFPPDISDRATSLALVTGSTVDRTRLICALLESLESWYRSAFPAVLDRWRTRTRMFGRPVTVTTPQEVLAGTAIRLAADGGLVVEVDGTARTVYAGDVTLSPHREI